MIEVNKREGGMIIRVKAKDLKIDDYLLMTDEKVASVGFKFMGTTFERKKVYLVFENKKGKKRWAEWNKETEVSVDRQM